MTNITALLIIWNLSLILWGLSLIERKKKNRHIIGIDFGYGQDSTVIVKAKANKDGTFTLLSVKECYELYHRNRPREEGRYLHPSR